MPYHRVQCSDIDALTHTCLSSLPASKPPKVRGVWTPRPIIGDIRHRRQTCRRGGFCFGKDAAAETKASHDVMDLVRENRELSLMVLKLHEARRSWPDVKAAVEAKTKTAKRSSDVLR